MTATHKDRLTLEQLHGEQVYLELTSKQKVLVDTFIQTNGDRTASVLAAYATKSKENAQIMAYTVLSSPRVVACLSTYFQSDPLEEFKAELRKAYRNKKLSVAQVNAMKLHAELNGWTADSLPSPTHPENAKPQALASPADTQIFPRQESVMTVPDRYKIGDIVPQKGVMYRITEIDADGQPTAAEPTE